MRKISRGRGFGGAVRYVFDNKHARHLCNSDAFVAHDAQEMIAEFAESYLTRPDCKKPVWHQALRLPAGERMTDEQLEVFARDYMRRMGFRDGLAQWTAVVHDEPKGLHIHIVASRVGLDGKLHYGRNENLISTRIVSEMEREYGLSISNGPTYIEIPGPNGEPTYKIHGTPRVRTAKTKELRRIERVNNERAEAGLPSIDPRAELLGVLAKARDQAVFDGLGAFLRVVESAGILVHASIAGQDQVRGLAFSTPDGSRFSGSQLGSIYSWPKLSRDIDYQAEDLAFLKVRCSRFPDAPAAVATAPKTQPVAPVHPVLVESKLEIKVVDVELIVLAPRKTQTIAEVLGLASFMELAPATALKRPSNSTFARRAAMEMVNWLAQQRQRSTTPTSTATRAAGATFYAKHPQQLPAHALRAGGSASLSALAASGGRTLTGQATLDSLRALPAVSLVLDASRGSQQGAGLLPRNAPADLVTGERAPVDRLRRAPTGSRAVDGVPTLSPGLLGRGGGAPAVAEAKTPMPAVARTQAPLSPASPSQEVEAPEHLAKMRVLAQATRMHQAEFQNRLGKILASERERRRHGDVMYLQAAAAFLMRERAEGREPNLAAWREFDRVEGSNVMADAHLPDQSGAALSRLSPAALRSPDAMLRQAAADKEMEVVIGAYGPEIMEQRRVARDAPAEVPRSKRNRR